MNFIHQKPRDVMLASSIFSALVFVLSGIIAEVYGYNTVIVSILKIVENRESMNEFQDKIDFIN